MIRKYSEMARKTFEKKWGGEGIQEVIHILNPDEMQGKGRLFADNFLPVGSSVGMHSHHGDFEAYFFLEGTGLYQTDDGEYQVEAGDVTIVDNHGSHGIKNIGDKPLRFIALILYSDEKESAEK